MKTTCASARSNLALLLILFLLLVSSPAHPAEEWIASAYRDAHRLEAAARYLDAATALRPVAEAYPYGYAVHLRLGWLHYRAGDTAASLEAYRIAIQAAPDALEPRLGLLLPLLARGEWEAAEQTAYRVLQEDPLNYYANLRLLTALRGQEKFELAQRQAERMVARYPADPALLREWAAVLEGVGEGERAEALRADLEFLDPQGGIR